MALTREEFQQEIVAPFTDMMNEILADMSPEERQEWADNISKREEMLKKSDRLACEAIEVNARKDFAEL